VSEAAKFVSEITVKAIALKPASVYKVDNNGMSSFGRLDQKLKGSAVSKAAGKLESDSAITTSEAIAAEPSAEAIKATAVSEAAAVQTSRTTAKVVLETTVQTLGEAVALTDAATSEAVVEGSVTTLIEMQLRPDGSQVRTDDEEQSIRAVLTREDDARTAAGRHTNFDHLNDLFACSKIQAQPPLSVQRVQTPASVHTSLACNQDVLSNYICLLCRRMVTFPVILNNGDTPKGMWPCGDGPFCRACIKAVILFNGQCPVCSRRTAEEQLVDDTRTERDQRSLAVTCSFREEGCSWQGELRDFASHQETCATRQAAANNLSPIELPDAADGSTQRRPVPPQPLSPPLQDIDTAQTEAQDWEQHRLLLEQESNAAMAAGEP
jgi:hypothetical protein